MIKNVTLFSLILSVFFSANIVLAAHSISPKEKHTVYEHMLDVNQEWAKYPNVSPILKSEIYFSDDIHRIQAHLSLVEGTLRKRNVEHLSTEQIEKRQHHLDVLKIYWQKGIFPKNIYHNKRQPYFIDHLGTACAVGHLIREDGGNVLTEKIRKENNYAYISELQSMYPEIKTWADNNGFTLEELAWIQPGYPPAEQSWSKVGNGGGIDGHINVMKAFGGSKLYMAGDFSSVDGVAANSIIAWNGTEWSTLGEGVEGEIFDIDFFQQRVIIAGNFILNSDSEYTNLAAWDGTEWIGLQKGEMNGSIYTLNVQGAFYVGGDFQNIDGKPISYIAKNTYYNGVLGDWNNYVTEYVGGSTYDTIYNALSVNAPVKKLEWIENALLVGGEFTQTAPTISDGSVNQLDTRYLAYWYQSDWETGFNGDYPPVNAIGYFDGHLAVGGLVGDEYSLSVMTAGLWEYSWLAQLDAVDGDGLIHGFLEFDDQFFVYGDISNQPLVGTYTDGFVRLYSNNPFGSADGAVFNKTIRAAESFQGEAYFAGDFTQVSTGWGTNGGEFKGLVRSPLDGVSSSNENLITKEIQIYHASGKLYVNYEDLENQADLNIYNLQGQAIKTINLQKGAANEIFDLPEWAAGTYVYQIVNQQGQQSGKFAAF